MCTTSPCPQRPAGFQCASGSRHRWFSNNRGSSSGAGCWARCGARGEIRELWCESFARCGARLLRDPAGWPGHTETLKGGFVDARNDPGFVRYAWGVRTERDKVTPHFDHPLVLLQLLGNDVAKDAAFFGFEIIPASAQFIEHPARYESVGRQLRCGMLEFLAGVGSMGFEDADVLETRIAFQILDAMRDQQQELFQFSIACGPKLPVMPEVLYQHLVRAHRRHAIVETIAAPRRLTLDPIQRRRMDHRAG